MSVISTNVVIENAIIVRGNNVTPPPNTEALYRPELKSILCCTVIGVVITGEHC